MNAPSRSMAIAGAVSLAAHAAVALAQAAHQSERTMPAHAPTEPAPNARRAPLAGPAVGRAAAPTLVHRVFEGTLRRLEIDPAEAALDLIDIDDDARQRVLAILDRRSAAMDRVVLDNLEQLNQIETAAESGQVFRVLQIASRLHKQLVAEIGDEPLTDQIAAVLPTQHAQAMHDLVEEYWIALAGEEGGENVGRIEAFVIRRRAALEIFGKEIERAFERISSDNEGEDQAWEHMLAALGLAPEHEREIRRMGERFYIESRLNPTKQELADFLTSVYLTLDTDQRTKFFQIIITSD